MDGDDQSSESGGNNQAGELSLIDLITDLASSRPDGISEDEREELVENATDLLSEDADNRRTLADNGGACDRTFVFCDSRQMFMLKRLYCLCGDTDCFAPLLFNASLFVFSSSCSPQVRWKICQSKNCTIVRCCHHQ
jgi:hypothetical protein